MTPDVNTSLSEMSLLPHEINRRAFWLHHAQQDADLNGAASVEFLEFVRQFVGGDQRKILAFITGGVDTI